MPVVKTMLPSLPKERPMVVKASKCDMDFLLDIPTSHVPSNSTSREEIYENKDDLWSEVDEFNEPEAEQFEDESKSLDYQQNGGSISTY